MAHYNQTQMINNQKADLSVHKGKERGLIFNGSQKWRQCFGGMGMREFEGILRLLECLVPSNEKSKKIKHDK